jgi:hypothetical protein
MGMRLSLLRAEIRDEIDHACRLFSTAQGMRGFTDRKLVADRVA